jgi:predicted transposase YbfD/YdcC
LWDEDVRAATTRDKGHGRVEVRTITTSTWANGYADWPRVGQVFRVERERRAKGVTTVEVVYGVTSLTREQAGAARLLALVRSHWGIENGLHHVRDVTFREDAGRVRSGSAPQVLASLRNVAVYLLNRMAGVPSIAAATRRVAANPAIVLPWLGLPDPTTE